MLFQFVQLGAMLRTVSVDATVWIMPDVFTETVLVQTAANQGGPEAAVASEVILENKSQQTLDL